MATQDGRLTTVQLSVGMDEMRIHIVNAIRAHFDEIMPQIDAKIIQEIGLFDINEKIGWMVREEMEKSIKMSVRRLIDKRVAETVKDLEDKLFNEELNRIKAKPESTEKES